MAGGAPDHIPEACKKLGFGALCSYSETLALLFLGFVVLVVSISLSLHFVEHWIHHRFSGIHHAGLSHALKDSVSRVKEEFMITGMIALLLFAFGRDLEAATCFKFDEYKDAKHDNIEGRRRRLLAEGTNCKEATIPFLELEYAHILLFMAALVNVVYSVLTISVTMKRIYNWKAYEDTIAKSEMTSLSERGIYDITRGRLMTSLKCWYRQFCFPFVWPGVDKDAYMSARNVAMEYWRPLIYRQMLLKAQAAASFVLESRIQMLLQPKVEQTDEAPLEKTTVDDLLGVAQRFRDESYFLSAAAMDKAEVVQLRKRRFDALYRIKVREFRFINLLQMLAASQFAEDRIMAFLMPTIIGLSLLMPHQYRLLAWFPPVVWLVMMAIGYELQRVLQLLKRRYQVRYQQEFEGINRRFKMRARICRAYAKWRAQHNKPPAKQLISHESEGPRFPDAVSEEKVRKRLIKRAKKKYTQEHFESTKLFALPAGLLQRLSVFCYYCNAFFLAMVTYTALIKREEFMERLGLMMYLVVFSLACMLHGALNITPLFSLILSSSSHTPDQFPEDLEAAQNKEREDENADSIFLWLKDCKNVEKHTLQASTMSSSVAREAVISDAPLRERYGIGVAMEKGEVHVGVGGVGVESQIRPPGGRGRAYVEDDDVMRPDIESLIHRS